VGGGRYQPLRAPSEIVGYTLRYNDSWPPLYNFAFAGWGILTGWSVFTHRTMAWLFGLLSVAAAYRLGRSVSVAEGPRREWAGLLAATLLGTTAFYVHYMHEMRGYTMGVFFAVMSLWLYWRLANGRGNGWQMLLFVLFNAGLLYTHYIVALLLAGVGVYHLTFGLRLRDQRWWIVLGLLTLSALSVLPWLSGLMTVVSGESRSSRGMATGTALLEMLRGYGNGLWVVLPLMLGAAVWRVRTRAAAYLWTVAGVFLVAAIVANTFLDYLLHIRHTMGIIPVLATLAALAVADMLNSDGRLIRLAAAGLLGLWLIGGGWNMVDDRFMASMEGAEYVMPRDTLDTILELSENCIRADEKAVFYLTDDYPFEWVNDLPLLHYLWTDVPFEYALLRKLRHIPDTYILERGSRIRTEEPENYRERVRWYADDSERVWLFARTSLPRDERVMAFETTLSETYSTCSRVQSQAGLEVYVWSQSEALSCPALEEVRLEACAEPIVLMEGE